SPLNRFSFLRTESPFLSAALRHPTTKFLLYNELAPLVKSRTDLYFASYKDVSPLVPQDLFDKSEEEEIKAFDSRVTKPLLVFLGLDESKRGDDGMGYKVYKGAPYFAVDVTPKGTIASQAMDVIEAMKQRDLFFDTSRTPTSFPPDQAAIFAQGRHLIDWNNRYTFCGTCGSKLMSTQAGTKRVCPTRDAALIANGVSQDGATPECSSRARVSNVCFPRTDPTIIVAVLSHDGKRMLLGRQARWPEKWYSTLAGFVEPAESIEDAVRREVWEESGY
ncbi:NADH pyrophosphatase, partial [Ascosphaera atra]